MGTVDTNMEKKIRWIMANLATAANALSGADRREWPDFFDEDDAENTPLPQDTEAIHNCFNRDEAIRRIQATQSDPSAQLRDVIVDRLAVDVLGAMERCYRARHRTRIRDIAHRSATLSSAGTPAGTIYRSYMDYPQRMMQAGGE